MKELFTFDDVLIVPKFSSIRSRKDVDISVNVGAFPYMNLPIISANMDTVTGSNMAKAMQIADAQAVLHRFCTIEENVKMFLDSKVGGTGGYDVPFVSIGLGRSEIERAEALRDAGAHTFVIDVAHGAQMSVVEQAIELRSILGGHYAIIVGNFATGSSIQEFLFRSATTVDGFKVGIGPGSACTTRIKTGVGYPQLSAIMDVANTLKKTGLAVIADGGVRTSGDVAKAIGAGAHMVMLGGMLAGTDESPGEVINKAYPVSEEPGATSVIKKVKKYRGSASKESYELQGKDASWRTAEGESFFVPYKGPVKAILQDIEGGLRSAMSYVGASNIREFHEKCEFVRISSSTVVENKPHGKGA